jgi:hypothetical protein
MGIVSHARSSVEFGSLYTRCQGYTCCAYKMLFLVPFFIFIRCKLGRMFFFLKMHPSLHGFLCLAISFLILFIGVNYVFYLAD